MKQIFYVAAALFVFAGCAPQDYEPYATRGLYKPPKDYDQFSLERTACYGICPIYQVIVNERDILEFRGERFVAEEGGAVGRRLEDGAFDQLVEIAREYDFAAFDKTYPNDDATNCQRYVTDHPSIIVSIKSGKLTHAVRLYEGCAGFTGRERWIEMIAEMEAVLKIDDLVGPREAHTGTVEQ